MAAAVYSVQGSHFRTMAERVGSAALRLGLRT